MSQPLWIETDDGIVGLRFDAEEEGDVIGHGTSEIEVLKRDLGRLCDEVKAFSKSVEIALGNLEHKILRVEGKL